MLPHIMRCSNITTTAVLHLFIKPQIHKNLTAKFLKLKQINFLNMDSETPVECDNDAVIALNYAS